jgi:predicted Fe-Mo cluster-binding NifX family protein
MKVAITVWKDRVAPVFDVAGSCIIGETLGYGHPLQEQQVVSLPVLSIQNKVALLVSMGVSFLVCGALSQECELQVVSQDIELFSFIAGDINDVVSAWGNGSLAEQRYSMPGCGCPRHRRRQARRGCQNGSGHNR